MMGREIHFMIIHNIVANKYRVFKGGPEMHVLNAIWPLSRKKKKKVFPVYRTAFEIS